MLELIRLLSILFAVIWLYLEILRFLAIARN